jgi:hypothetical protein
VAARDPAAGTRGPRTWPRGPGRCLRPPRPGGTLAAIAACPDADVIFVAHARLDNIVSVGDVWRDFPIDERIRAPVVAGAARRGPADRHPRRPSAVAL